MGYPIPAVAVIQCEGLTLRNIPIVIIGLKIVEVGTPICRIHWTAGRYSSTQARCKSGSPSGTQDRKLS